MKLNLKSRKVQIGLWVALILIGARVSLPFVARAWVNGQLNRDPLYRSSIEDLQMHLWKGAATVTRLRIQRVHGQKVYPFVAVERIEAGLNWRDLLHGSIVAKLRIEKPEMNITRESIVENGEKKEKVAVGGNSKEEKQKELQTWQEVIKNLTPLDISELSVVNGKVHFRDLTTHPPVNIYLDQVTVNGHNLTNSTRVSDTLFGTVTLNASAMRSGNLKVDLYIDPLSSPPKFKMNLRLADLDLTELNQFFRAYGKFNVKSGKFSLYSEVATSDKNLKGYFKPLIHELDVADLKQDIKHGIFHAAWEQVVGLVGGIFKNHAKDQQGTKVPVSGKLDDFDVDLWTMVASTLENVFIKAIRPDLDHSIHLRDVRGAKKK